jgi:hypothetical protein
MARAILKTLLNHLVISRLACLEKRRAVDGHTILDTDRAGQDRETSVLTCEITGMKVDGDAL